MKSNTTRAFRQRFCRKAFTLLLTGWCLLGAESQSFGIEPAPQVAKAVAQMPVAPKTNTEKANIPIGEGYDPENPGNPNSPDINLKHPLTVSAVPPTAGSVNPSGTTSMEENETRLVYAYPNANWKFTGWTVNGEKQPTTTSPISITMGDKALDVVALFTYEPSDPGNPNAPDISLKHPLTVSAVPPAAGSVNPSGTTSMEENETRLIYAYPNANWKFTGWTVNGEKQPTTTSPISITMGDKALDVVALFTYEPSDPGNPGANHYNATTGEVIIDDFKPGNLYSALAAVVGYSGFSNINSLIVKGIMNSNDLGNMGKLSNTSFIDLSRTGGIETITGYTFNNLNATNILLPSTVTDFGGYVFNNCSNITSLTLYSEVPPRCTSSTFTGFSGKNNCTLFVPLSSIELYTTADYWKDFTILPIIDDSHILQVNLPEDADDGRYKNNSLEIVNVNTGVRQKYVISDRILYTFNGLRKDEQYNIYMYSKAGLELGRIENVTVPDTDFEVTFESLKPVHNVNAIVLTPEGNDVTNDVMIEWLRPVTEGSPIYMRKASSLGEIPEGETLLCRVTLDNSLGSVYVNPKDTEITVGNAQNTCRINLVPFRHIDLSGRIVDGDGIALSGASVSVNQTLNGKFSKSYTAKTDRKGEWTLSVLDAPETRLTYAATECVNVNDTIGAFKPEIYSLDLGKTILKSIVGARVTYGFTYHAAGSEDVEDYYSDYQNILVSVFNVTQNRAHNEVSLQYPILAVLDENINTGDELRLTATSKTGAFNPIVETIAVGENQRAEVTFDIVGKGGIVSSFEMTDNPAVIAMLYSSNGELLKKQTYAEAKTIFGKGTAV